MARYRNDLDDERDYYPREERHETRKSRRLRRTIQSPPSCSRLNGGLTINRGRFGERAEYDYDEPRYGDYRERYRDEGRSSLFDIRGDLSAGRVIIIANQSVHGCVAATS